MTVRLDTNWTFFGLQAIVLENTLLRLVILPELGGKIWSLIHKPTDREILYHHPRITPRPAPFGGAYDNWFCGGWDEMFPTDAPTLIAGETYPDHGEVWSMPATVEILKNTASSVSLRLINNGIITPTRFEKTLTVHAGESRLHVHYAIHNGGPDPIDFLWRLHPALNLDGPTRLDLPSSRIVVNPDFAADFTSLEFPWPNAPTAGGHTDLRLVPPITAHSAHAYDVVDFATGWCAVTQMEAKIGFGLAFDPRVLSSIGVFGAYGGWRGLYTLLPEPGVCHPSKLDRAIQQGTAAHLAPGATLETEVTAVVYTGHDHVTAISRDGEVIS